MKAKDSQPKHIVNLLISTSNAIDIFANTEQAMGPKLGERRSKKGVVIPSWQDGSLAPLLEVMLLPVGLLIIRADNDEDRQQNGDGGDISTTICHLSQGLKAADVTTERV